ncbi:MAG: YeiH family protein [Burkholderiaceae bacterium]|uniref:YeiH family putative sulfate export transporter n=1 Tax=Herminiimonas contaminans TaxID=1111140 RepID=A0ABS0ER69_9BURK|nr:YeiH family protein [Herminiimonas contaminans]MBF8177345.1 YeiH family putative sulfate export transporter [Herminiimonas contaminans]MBX9799939.1 YeiH family protein [Burkholderiaceae bacterium]
MSSIPTSPSTAPSSVKLERATSSGGQWQQLLPGLTLTGLIAVLAIALGNIEVLQANGISALTLAIVLGILVGNTVYPRIAPASAAGVQFSKAKLLRLGIILYGLRLTFQDIANVGWSGVVIDAMVLSSTFGLAYVLGTRVFGLERQTALLIGAGSSICGAAAVMATEPVVRGRAEQVTVAVATVVVFGTLAIFLYPALYHLNADYQLITMTPSSYGVFAGSTIHEVAQVVAAGRAVSEAAANTAVIAKMVRVMMLAPFLLILTLWLARRSSTLVAGQRMRITIPWFALCFVAVAGLNSLAVLPPVIVHQLTTLDTVLLAMAMAGLGLGTHISVIRKAGIKPLALGAVLFAWLLAGGLAINALVHALLH